MNLFSHKRLLIYYLVFVSVFCLQEVIALDDRKGPLDTCSLIQTSDQYIKRSFFVEQVTSAPDIFHISDPVRMAVDVNIPSNEAKSLSNTWITIYFNQHSSVCFLSNHEITKEMEEKSDFLHDNLQNRIND